MNGIQPLSPHSISSLFNRQRTLNYEKLDVRTREQTELFSSESDASGSRSIAGTFSRQQALSYERLVVQENTSQAQLQRRNHSDQLDVRASQQYSSYLMVEKITLRVEEQFGFTAEETDRLSGLDTSIQGAASSIFELSITIYTQYEAETLESDESADRGDILARFMSQMREAVDRGFHDALNILGGMNGFDEEIQSSIEESYNMLKAILDRFEEAQRKRIDGADEISGFQEDLLAVQEEILSATADADQPTSAETGESGNRVVN